jgi:hypothetical protein
MTSSEKFSDLNFKNLGPSSRGLTDPPPEPELDEELPQVQEMIDILYRVMMKRLDDIEVTQQTIIDLCHQMKSPS